jgi:hypothetical protein
VTAINAGALVRAQAGSRAGPDLVVFAQLMQAPVAVCVMTGPEFVSACQPAVPGDGGAKGRWWGSLSARLHPELKQDSAGLPDSGRKSFQRRPWIAEEYLRQPLPTAGNGLEDRYYKFTRPTGVRDRLWCD